MSLGINTVTVTSAGTAVQFGTDTRPWTQITFKARPNNGSLVYVGTSGVNSTAGIALNPSEAYDFVAKSGAGVTLAQLYADADINNDAVDYWVYGG